MFLRIFLIAFLFLQGVSTSAVSLNDQDINLRNEPSYNTLSENSLLQQFIYSVDGGFIDTANTGLSGAEQLMFTIAFEIKNIIIWIAIIFLLISVIRLLFLGDKEASTKWRNSIIYTTLGIIFLQSAFAIWYAFQFEPLETVNAGFAWKLITNIIFPLVGLLQMLAAFAFIAMGIYAFYQIVTSGYADDARKKGIQTFLYAALGFMLIRVPEPLVRAIYGNPTCSKTTFGLATIGDCAISDANLSDSIGIVGTIINFFNSFIALVCVLLVIWAGWLILTAGESQDQLKKARKVILYIFLGLVLLVASHAIFRFFILQS